MVCYAVPLIAAFFGFGWRGAFGGAKAHPVEERWLRLMLLGASVFGVVDHLWNGELMLMGDSIATDIALGCVITLAVFASWAIFVAFGRIAARPDVAAAV